MHSSNMCLVHFCLPFFLFFLILFDFHFDFASQKPLIFSLNSKAQKSNSDFDFRSLKIKRFDPNQTRMLRAFDHILNAATLFQFDFFKMDHKQDATSAGLPWPALQPRQPASKPAPRLPPGTTSPPASSASSAAPTPMGNTPPFAAIEPTAPASYSADPPQLGAPFPPPTTSWEHI